MLLRDLLLLSKILLSTCLFFTPHLVAVQASARTRALMIFRLPSSSRPEATLDHPAWPLLHKSCIFDIEFNWAEGRTLYSSVAKIKVLAYGAQREHVYVYWLYGSICVGSHLQWKLITLLPVGLVLPLWDSRDRWPSCINWAGVDEAKR